MRGQPAVAMLPPPRHPDQPDRGKVSLSVAAVRGRTRAAARCHSFALRCRTCVAARARQLVLGKLGKVGVSR